MTSFVSEGQIQKKTNSARYWLAIVVMFAVVQQSGWAQTDLPSKVVRKYCRLDLQGVRMSGATWQQGAPLIDWEDEPGWDTFTLTLGFRILEERVHKDHATVRVAYDVAGEVDSSWRLELKRWTETITFQLIRKAGKWKIEAPTIQPHVSPKVLQDDFAKTLKEYSQSYSMEERRTLEAVIRKLGELSKSRPSAVPRSR